MRRCGEAVTKADILANVWDTDYPGSDNVVEVYVGYLRRKIDAPFGVTSSRRCAAWATGCTPSAERRPAATAGASSNRHHPSSVSVAASVPP